MTTPREPTPSPYGSARDLPSYREMASQIEGGKLLTGFIAREQRSELLKVEQQLSHLAAVVDRFYERLGWDTARFPSPSMNSARPCPKICPSRATVS